MYRHNWVGMSGLVHIELFTLNFPSNCNVCLNWSGLNCGNYFQFVRFGVDIPLSILSLLVSLSNLLISSSFNISTDSSRGGNTVRPYLQTSTDKLILRYVTVVVDIKVTEYLLGSVHRHRLVEPLVLVERGEQQHHLGQGDGPGAVGVVELEDPMEFVLEHSRTGIQLWWEEVDHLWGTWGHAV